MDIGGGIGGGLRRSERDKGGAYGHKKGHGEA